MSDESDPTPFPGHDITAGMVCARCGKRGYDLSYPCKIFTKAISPDFHQ